MPGILWPSGTRTRPAISSQYGMRWHPIHGVYVLHAGTDFIGFSTIHAIADGTVTHVGTPFGWSGGGVQVWIQHNGFMTRSMHLLAYSTKVRVGQKVKAGQALATMGMTGGATGVHLHLEVVYHNRQVDPVDFITSRMRPGSGAGGGTEMSNTPKEINNAVWHDEEFAFRSGLTPGQTLEAIRTGVARIEILTAAGATFVKHGGKNITLWIYFVPGTEDFVRIRDLETAQLYKEIAGRKAVVLSPEAIRLKVADAKAAGGRDLSAVKGSSRQTVLTEARDAETDATALRLDDATNN